MFDLSVLGRRMVRSPLRLPRGASPYRVPLIPRRRGASGDLVQVRHDEAFGVVETRAVHHGDGSAIFPLGAVADAALFVAFDVDVLLRFGGGGAGWAKRHVDYAPVSAGRRGR